MNYKPEIIGGKTVTYRIYYQVSNCINNKAATLSYNAYTVDGDVVVSSNSPYELYEYLIPDSRGLTWHKWVCNWLYQQK